MFYDSNVILRSNTEQSVGDSRDNETLLLDDGKMSTQHIYTAQMFSIVVSDFVLAHRPLQMH